DAGEAGDHRGFHHVAAKPRVLADHDPVAVIAAEEMGSRRLPYAERRLGRHWLDVSGAANAVGTEEFSCHLARITLSVTPAKAGVPLPWRDRRTAGFPLSRE